MKKRLVLVGGGHAHLYTVARMGDLVGSGSEVILISESPYHYYSGMGPGMLSGIYRPAEIRFNLRKMTEDRGGIFMEDAVERVSPRQRRLILRSGIEVGYDVASFNTGSEVPGDYPEGSDVYTVKPIINLLRARERMISLLAAKRLTVTVVGGGPAGVEIAGNVWRLSRDGKGDAEIHLIAGSRLLGAHPTAVRGYALESLVRRGIRVQEGLHVKNVEGGLVTLADGSSFSSDVVLIAVGVSASRLFAESGLATGARGGLLVNEFLQSVTDPGLLGGGDCISYEPQDLAKVGVYAVRQGPVLFQNISSALRGGSPVAFRPGGAYLLILNMGDGTGILWKRSFVWYGRLSFILKDYIDRRFMRRYQVSGERQQDGTI